MKRSNLLLLAAAVAGFGVFAAGCSTNLSPEPFDANLRLTAGQVKKTVKVGETSQAEIFASLGAPNIVALDSEAGEVWTYDQIRVRRTAQGYEAGAFFATVFGFSDFHKTTGGGRTVGKGAGEAGASISAGIDTITTSVSTATLIVRFDANETVSSYKMLVTSF